MATLGIEQAARVSGLSARELRMLIESGRLPATRPSGRWMVERRHLAAVDAAVSEVDPAPGPDQPDFVFPPDEVALQSSPRPHVQGGRPIGADPIATIVDIKASRVEQQLLPRFAPSVAATEQVPSAPAEAPEPDFRAQLDQTRAQVADLRLERDALRLKLREQVSSLQRSLEDAIEELDAARARAAELEARNHDATSREAGTGARAALTPLFQATTLPPKRRGE